MNFLLSTDGFDRGTLDDPENCATTADLTISVGDKTPTEHEDTRAKSVRSSIRVALYPLAHWFVRSYWRLCYETLPGSKQVPVEWRLAHELRTAGDGYDWPRIIFVPDGNDMIVWSLATRDTKPRAARYLNNIRAEAPIEQFRSEVIRFVQLVIARLESESIRNSALQELWPDLIQELSDKSLTRYRIAEARLGYDPDAVAEELINGFLAQSDSIGSAALDELAPVCARSNPTETLRRLEAWVSEVGTEGHPQVKLPADGGLSKARSHHHPAQLGQELARKARQVLHLDKPSISRNELSDLLGLTLDQAYALPEGEQPHERLSLGIRNDGDKVKYAFRRLDPFARRFELSRFLCDHLIASPNDRWQPVTGDDTVRQKVQRAFAAEFLCPMDELKGSLDEDYSDEAISDAAYRFGVQESVVKNQLRNHRVVSYGFFGGGGEFMPYKLAA